jgi:carboxyl-terminal processing protease
VARDRPHCPKMRRLAITMAGLAACSTGPRPASHPAPPAPAVSPAPAPAPAAPDPDRIPFGPDERAAELAQLRDAIAETYAHLETKQQQWGVDLGRVFERHEPKIREAETWSDYELVMVSFVASFHDGHVQWRRKRGAREGKRQIARIGLDSRFVGEALIVTHVWPGSAAERAGLRRGDKIVALDGKTIDQRLGELSRIRSWSRADAARHDFAGSWHVSRVPADQPPPDHRVTRERDDGSYETLAVAPETTPRPGGRPPPIELAKRGEVAILHVRDLRGRVKDTTERATEATAAIFAAPRGLVIDLRDNEGGYEDGARAIVARLTAKPVVGGVTRVRLSARARAAQRVWRDLEADPARPGWSKPLPLGVDPLAPRDYPGKLAVVIDAGCRSSCESMALLLRAMGARLFGERTGGAGGAPVMVPLPRSGSRVAIPARAAFDPSGAPIEGRGVGPDEHVTPTRADLAAGRDVALERAIDHVCPRGPGRC